MGSVKYVGQTSVRPLRASAWRGLGFPVLLAVERVTKLAYGELVEATLENAVAFLARLVAEFPQKIDAVTTEIGPAFVHVREAFGEYMRSVGPHPFAVACSAKGI